MVPGRSGTLRFWLNGQCPPSFFYHNVQECTDTRRHLQDFLSPLTRAAVSSELGFLFGDLNIAPPAGPYTPERSENPWLLEAVAPAVELTTVVFHVILSALRLLLLLLLFWIGLLLR